VLTQKEYWNLTGLFIKFMYTERILESIRYFDIFVLTQIGEMDIYMVFLYICVDTESKRNLPGLFIKFMYTERILESIGYFDIFVLTQIGEMDSILS